MMLVVLVASLAQLAGCASSPRSDQGVKWVTENEAEKARLNNEGFPQYVGSN